MFLLVVGRKKVHRFSDIQITFLVTMTTLMALQLKWRSNQISNTRQTSHKSRPFYSLVYRLTIYPLMVATNSREEKNRQTGFLPLMDFNFKQPKMLV